MSGVVQAHTVDKDNPLLRNADTNFSISSDLDLTPDEIAWLEKHRTINIGIDPSWEPYEFTNNSGVYQGIVADYLKLIEGRIGVKFLPKKNLSWDQAAQQLKDSRLDLSAALTSTRDRNNYLNFTRPYLKTQIAVVTRDNHATVTNLSVFAGKKVALLKSYSFTDSALKAEPQLIPVYVNTVIEGLQKVSNHEVEGIICDLPSLSYKIREYNLLNLKVAGFAPFQTDGLRMAVRKDWPLLPQILEKALDSITADEEQQIRQRWIGIEGTETSLVLTPNEKKWLLENPVIQVMFDPDWAPIEFFDNSGAAAGVTSEYLSRLSQILKVKFEPVHNQNWTQMLKQLNDGTIPMAACIRETPSQRNKIIFTPDYISIPTGIFTRNEVTFSDIHTLEGKEVAIVENYAVYDYIKTQHPKIHVILVENRKAGLTMVSEGKAFAYIDALPAGCHGISNYRFTNLRLTGEVDFSYEMSMGISVKYPELASILRKALNSISEADRNSFYEKWFTMQTSYKPDYSIIWKITLIAVVVILYFVFWNRKLEQRVRQRTAELQKANSHLQSELLERERIEAEHKRLEEQLAQAQKMESIGRLAGGVAHDFNNMLGVIIGHCDLMRADIPVKSEAHESLLQILEASERARNLTQQLLAFSRKQLLQIRVVDLNNIVLNMEKMIRHLLREDIQMQFRLGDNIGHVKADPHRIEQVLMNLSINSRDAMPKGGTLTIETGMAVLDKSFEPNQPVFKPGKYVMLRVTDTGFGMDKETLQHVFDPFFTTKDVGKGTGLGLATVYGILKQHEGEIQVTSKPGQGTSFTAYLPVTDEPLSLDVNEASDSVISGHEETILVVEDEEAVRRLTCSLLRRLNYNVLEAKDASECIALATQSKQIDLLLCDVIMPEVNGRQLYQQINVIRPKIKTIFISGYPEEILGRHGILDPGVQFIAKPFTEKSLSQKIREVLSPPPI